MPCPTSWTTYSSHPTQPRTTPHRRWCLDPRNYRPHTTPAPTPVETDTGRPTCAFGAFLPDAYYPAVHGVLGVLRSWQAYQFHALPAGQGLGWADCDMARLDHSASPTFGRPPPPAPQHATVVYAWVIFACSLTLRGRPPRPGVATTFRPRADRARQDDLPGAVAPRGWTLLVACMRSPTSPCLPLHFCDAGRPHPTTAQPYRRAPPPHISARVSAWAVNISRPLLRYYALERLSARGRHLVASSLNDHRVSRVASDRTSCRRALFAVSAFSGQNGGDMLADAVTTAAWHAAASLTHTAFHLSENGAGAWRRVAAYRIGTRCGGISPLYLWLSGACERQNAPRSPARLLSTVRPGEGARRGGARASNAAATARVARVYQPLGAGQPRWRAT